MKKMTISLLVLVFGMGAVAYAMSELSVSGEWRYKITIAIETPEGIKSGSTVRKVFNSASSIDIGFPNAINPARTIGEAVVIDLEENGLLFALMSTDSEQELYEAFPVKGATTVKGIKHFNSVPIGKKAFIHNYIPTLVRFRDINDPKSVELVYSKFRADIENNFEKTYGPEYKLDSISVERVEESIVWHITDILTWLNSYYDNQLDGLNIQTTYSNNPVANRFSAGHFSTKRNIK